MCLNSGGENDNGQNFFSIFFWRGGKWQRGENDRGYYGNLNLHQILSTTEIFLISWGRLDKGFYGISQRQKRLLVPKGIDSDRNRAEDGSSTIDRDGCTRDGDSQTVYKKIIVFSWKNCKI